MIARICLVSIALSWSGTVSSVAQERQREAHSPGLVVAFDQDAAKLLHPKSLLGVLVKDGSDGYETINARALSMRHANYFVYQSGQSSALAAMYRERLGSHGVVAIELPRPARQRKAVALSLAERRPQLRSTESKLAHLFLAPQE